MPNYTTNLNLEKPLDSEQYNIAVFNANADKIDTFAGQIPARALTADKLTTGAKINNVLFKGNSDITLPVATNSVAGTVKPDNDTILVDGNGVLSTAFPISGDYVNNSKALETGSISNNAVIYSDIRKYAHSTFDYSKFTVVGTPTITDDGIASDFTFNVNYVKLSNADTFAKIGQKPFRVTFGGVMSPAATDFLLASAGSTNIFYIGHILNNSAFIFKFTNSNNVVKQIYIDIPNAKVGKNYVGYVGYDGSKFYLGLKFEDENDYTVVNTADTYGLVTTALDFHIGNPYGAAIDLKQLAVFVDGIMVFSGNQTGTEIINANNYDVTGNPNIMLGVLNTSSSYNASNNISYDGIDLKNGNTDGFDVYFEFELNALPSAEKRIMTIAAQNETNSLIIFGITSTNKPYIQFWKSGSFSGGLNFDTELTANTKYGFKLSGIKNSWTSVFYGTSTAEKQTAGLSYPLAENTAKILFLYASIANMKFNLKTLRISVEGKLVYSPYMAIDYTLSNTGSRITATSNYNLITEMYKNNGYSMYYTIDEENNTFTLPMGEIYGMINKSNYLLDSYDNGYDWYRIYKNADGVGTWIEQGGRASLSSQDVPFVQPILTSNGTMGGSSFAVNASNSYAPHYPWKAFDGKNTSIYDNWYTTAQTSTYDMYNPIALKVTNIKIANTTAGTYAIQTGFISVSDDGSSWTQIKTFTNSTTTAGASWDIDLSSNTGYHKYYRIGTTTANVGIGEITLTAVYQTSAQNSINFLQPFENTGYSYGLSFEGASGSAVYVSSKTVSGLSLAGTSSAVTVNWTAQGRGE